MIWIQQTDTIYVMYNIGQPAWEVYEDQFEEGMPEKNENWATPPSIKLFQPRRGFGTLWRSSSTVRERIGWALDEWETPFSSNAQEADDGSVFLSDPDGGVVVLLAGQEEWQRYYAGGAPSRFRYDLLPTLTPTP